MNHIAILESRC